MKYITGAVAILLVGIVIVLTLGRLSPQKYINLEDRIRQSMGE